MKIQIAAITYDIQEEHLEKSKYFSAIFSTEDYNKDVPIQIPSEYPTELLNFVFHKSDIIPEEKLYDTFSVCLYFDLRYDFFFEFIQDLISKLTICLPLMPIVLEILEINHCDPKISLDNYFDKLLEDHPEEFKELYVTSRSLQEKLWPHLYRHRHICEPNLDILLFDFSIYEPRMNSLNNFSESIEKFNHISNNIFLKDFKWDNIIIAGGAILDSVHKKTLNEDTDVDIWIYGAKEQRKQAIIYLLNYLRSKMEGYYSHKGSVIYFFPINIPRCFQIIQTNYVTKYELLDYFDYSCCKILYDGDRLLCTKNFINSIKTKVIHRSPFQNFAPQRLNKMLSKGFTYMLTPEEKTIYDLHIESIDRKPHYLTKSDNTENINLLKQTYDFKNSVTNDINVLLTEFNFDNIIHSYFTGSLINELTFREKYQTDRHMQMEILRNESKIKFQIKITSVNNKVYARHPDQATFQIPYLSLPPYTRLLIYNLNSYVKTLNDGNGLDEHVRKFVGKKVPYEVQEIIKLPLVMDDDICIDGDQYISIKTKNVVIDGKQYDLVKKITNSPRSFINEIEWEKKYEILANVVPYLWMNKLARMRDKKREVGIVLFAASVEFKTCGKR
ncbi:MAG: hypothetical protein Harvfovirus5_30 [Harvfovirus sp.]|uniref:Uncharacterized protein n=1 Tax=Harvfovirus sp. TaxID=2487768 RepID=A0A3G5A0H7_9VIRU|nr:MAG: hypothetical protein Harvfovirus5_30 [Harvfovirus sp.]